MASLARQASRVPYTRWLDKLIMNVMNGLTKEQNLSLSSAQIGNQAIHKHVSNPKKDERRKVEADFSVFFRLKSILFAKTNHAS